MSKPNKSSTLWNVLDPDDPYDIKKSMIARLPDHPSQPMGQHLELVCLLQAAQIERLSDYLTQIKSKYRQMERRELDRHSYEIQIKELAEKNISLNNLQKQNERLKDFIRRQGMELEEIQKKNMASINFETVQAKYEGVLNQLRISRTQNENSEKTIARLNVELMEWRGRWEKAEQDRINFTSQFQIQWRQKLNQEIKIAKERAEERADRLQLQVRQLKEVIQNKNHQIQGLTAQRDSFIRQIRLLEEKNKNKGNIEEAINEKNRQIQRLNVIITERTTKLQQAISSAQKLSGQLNIIEQRYRNIQRQRQKLIVRIRQFESMKLKNDNLDRMEEKIAMMSMEIQRLNGLNAARARECADANGQIQRLKFQLRNNQGSKQHLERERQRISKLESQIQILRVGQSRVKILTDELQRVRVTLNLKNQEMYTLQQRLSVTQVNTMEITTLTKQKTRLQQELQISLQKIQNMKNTINANQTNAFDLAKLAKERSTLEQELQAARAQYRNYKNITQNQINSLKNQNQRIRQDLDYNSVSRSEYEKYRVQTDRLRAQIQRIRGQSITIRKIFEEQKSNGMKIEAQRSNLLLENQNMLNELLHLKKQIQSLKLLGKTFEEKQRLLQSKQFEIINLQRLNNNLSLQLQDIKGRNQKLEGSVQSIYNQIERLHSILSAKVNENQKLIRDISQFEQKCRFYESKLGSNANERQYYEKQINKLRLQIQTTTKLSNEASRELMNRINDFLVQKQKQDKLLIQKQKLITQFSKEKQSLEKKLVQIQRDFALRVSSQQQSKKERDQMRSQRQQYYQQLRIKETTILQLQTVIREKQNIGRESQGKVKVWESRVTEWQSRLKDAERGLQTREEEADRYKRENQRLNSQIQRFSQELQEIVRQRQTIINENNQLKRRIQQLMKDQKTKLAQDQLRSQLKMAEQALFRQRKQTQNLRNNCRVLEQNLNRQTKELESCRQNVKEYQLKIVHIQTTQTRMLEQKIKDYQKKLQQRDNLVINLQRQIKQMEAQLGSVVARDQDALNNLQKYEDKISLLSVQIERLNHKLEDKSRESREKQAYIQNMAAKSHQPDKDTLDKMRQYESKLNFYASQIEKFKIIISERQREINDKNNAIQSLTIKINQSLNTSHHQPNAQVIERYQIQNKNLNQALEALQNINIHTTAERDELFKVSHELQAELDDLSFKYGEQERHLRGELNYRMQESKRFGEELGMLKKKQQSLFIKIQQYERIINSRADDRQFKGRISELQVQVQAYTRQINELRIENTNLKQEVNQLMIINQELNIKVGQSSNYSRDQVARLTSKLKELNIILQTKDQQILQWDQKYSSLYSAYQQLYHNYQITKSEYDVTLANIKSYQAKLFKIGDDYEALALVLRTKQQQIYDLKMRFKSDGDLYEKNLILSKEIDRLTQINKRLQGQVSELRLNLTDNVSLHKRIQEQLGLLVVLFAEIESLRSRLINSENECEEVRRSSLAPHRVDRRL